MGCVSVCACNYSLGNAGTDCIPIHEVTKRLIFVPIFDSTGVRNYLNLAVTPSQSAFTALINQSDGSKRWYPLPEMKNIEDKRADAVLQKFNDDSTIYIRDGIRTFSGLFVGMKASPILKAKIEAARCVPVGCYFVDRNGSLIGTLSDDKTKLYPTRIDNESIAAIYMKTSDTEKQTMKVTFNFDSTENDACLGMVTAAELVDATPLIWNGLYDVYVTYSSITTTGLVAELYTDFGTALNKVRVKGLVVTDFISSSTLATSKARNTTTSAEVSLTSVTEGTGTSAGKYTLAFSAQASASKIVTLVTKTGYDFSGLVATPATIP